MDQATAFESFDRRKAPPALAERVRRFEAAWSSGSRPSLSDYVADLSPEEAGELASHLIRLDAAQRWRRGDVPQVEDYRECFPNMSPESLAGLIETARASQPGSSSNGEKFEDRATRSLHSTTSDGPRADYVCCPQCHNPIAAPAHEASELVCEACGSSFRVQDVDQRTTRRDEPRPFGRFRLLERLGSGSFGTVWKAFDTDLRRMVALKIPHARLIDSAKYRERFLREARAAAQLDHPGIVRLYDVPVVEDTPVLVSDLIEGISLRDLLAAGRPPFRVAASITADIAEALDEAHARRLVHRDIKPGNVIVKAEARPGRAESFGPLGRWGKPVIVDFGLALRSEAEIVMTVEGQLVGTPAYMSPEQIAHAHRVDGRSDLYSLGVVLYEMLCGELPFRGSKAMIVHQVLHEEPRAPRKLNDKIPRDLETICLKAMAKERARRYETGSAMGEDLRRFLRGAPILARPVGRLERSWLWCLRNPLIAGLWAAVVLVLIAGTAVSSYFAIEASWRAGREAIARREAGEAARKATAAEEFARRRWYDAEMAVASRYWREQRVGQVLDTLNALMPGTGASDLRGFDWYCLERRCSPELRALGDQRSPIRSLALSASGRLVGIGSDDGIVRIWDLADSEKPIELSGHAGSVRCLVFHPDGFHLLSGGEDRTVRLWNLKTRTQEKLLPEQPARITGLAICREGTRLFVASGGSPERGASSPGTLSFYEFPTGTPFARALEDTRSFAHLALSPSGRELALLVDTPRLSTIVRVWDCSLRRYVRDFEESVAIHSLSFSPDGGRLAWAGDQHTLRLWDRSKDQVLTFARRTGLRMNTVTFSPDGRRLGSGGSDESITVWDADTGSELLTLVGHRGHVECVRFSPDGRRLVSAGMDGALKVWDPVVLTEPRIFRDAEGPAVAAAFGPSGRLAYAQGSDVFLRDLASSRVLWSIKGPGSACGLACARDGKTVAVGDVSGTLSIRDAQTGERLRAWQAHSSFFRFAAYSPRGDQLAAGSGHNVTIWDPRDGHEIASLPPCEGNALAAAFDPGGRLLAVADGAGAVLIWSVPDGHLLHRLTGLGKTVFAVAFHPRLPLVAGAGSDGTVRLWDVISGEQRQPPLSGHAGPARCVCFSPDGERLATADGEGTVHIWDTATGGQLLVLEGHTGPIFTLAFSSDGLWLVSGSADGTVRVWDGHRLTPDMLEQREATSIVRTLEWHHLAPAEIVSQIRQDATINEKVRERALALVAGKPRGSR